MFEYKKAFLLCDNKTESNMTWHANSRPKTQRQRLVQFNLPNQEDKGHDYFIWKCHKGKNASCSALLVTVSEHRSVKCFSHGWTDWSGLRHLGLPSSARCRLPPSPLPAPAEGHRSTFYFKKKMGRFLHWLTTVITTLIQWAPQNLRMKDVRAGQKESFIEKYVIFLKHGIQTQALY